MTPYEQIQMEALGLSKGQSLRTVCPWCHGGSSGELSFVISNDKGVIKYHCFRNSCVRVSRGKVLNSGRASDRNISTKETRVREFKWDTYPLSDATLERLWVTYSIPEQLAKQYNLVQTHDGSIVVPTYSYDGTLTGHVVRLANPRDQKVLSYPGHEGFGMSWFTHLESDILIIVEDVFSAMRASEYVNAVSLLGSDINPERAVEISKGGYSRVYLTLDADASGAASKLALKYRSIIPNLYVRRLVDKDIKNFTMAEADSWFLDVIRI